MKEDIDHSVNKLDYANREIFKNINELKAMRIACDAAILTDHIAIFRLFKS
jgi:hypothetical protein